MGTSTPVSGAPPLARDVGGSLSSTSALHGMDAGSSAGSSVSSTGALAVHEASLRIACTARVRYGADACGPGLPASGSPAPDKLPA